MIFLLGVVFVIGLSVWLWGEENVKTAIKWLLGLSITIIFLVFVINYIDKKANQDREAELQKSYEMEPVAPDTIAALPIAPNKHSQEKLSQADQSPDGNQKNLDCYKRFHKSQEEAKSKLPECARFIVRYADEKENKCRINWDLQNDEGIKAKDLYESDKEEDETFDRLITCASSQ